MGRDTSDNFRARRRLPSPDDTSPAAARLPAVAHRPELCFAAGLRSMYATTTLHPEPSTGAAATMTVLLEAGLGPAVPDDEETR